MIRFGLRGAIGLVALGAMASGCATFRAGLTPSVQAWPPTAGTTRKSIAITARMESTIDMGPNHGPMPVSDGELNQLRGRVWSEYQDSGIFSDVKTGLEDADVRADVLLQHHGDGSMGLAILSGLTMMMVPLKTTVDDLTFITTFKDRDGNVTGTIKKTERLNTWFHAFLVFVAPFKNVIGQSNDATKDLLRATIAEARSQGLI